MNEVVCVAVTFPKNISETSLVYERSSNTTIQTTTMMRTIQTIQTTRNSIPHPFCRRKSSSMMKKATMQTTATLNENTTRTPTVATTKTTVGALIQDAKTVEEILHAANESLLLLGEETLHFHFQDVHRQKNKSASVNGLKRLAKMMCSSSGSYEKKKKKNNNNERIGGIVRLIKGASLDGTNKTNRKKRASDGIDALRATASLLVSLFDEDEDEDEDDSDTSREEMRNACDELARRVREDAEYFSDGDRIIFDWALRVIESTIASSSGETTTSERRGDATITVDEFPFRYVTPNISNVLKNITVEDLRKEVPFKAEKLITRTGKRVDERRETCFVAESGIGGLAYSGKIMEPTLLNEATLPLVTTIRNAIVEALKNDEDYAGCDIDFDCALMNLYPDGSSACAWHTDPEMGTVWDRDSVIVSIGETRRFAFRKLAGGGDKTQNDGEEEQVWVRVHHGDCILMRDDCNDNWEHCVFGKENDSNNAARISLVFKKALSRGGGRKKGHGTNSKEKKRAK